jgi:hypothetical protein
MDIKKSIEKWFNGPQDYHEGIDLLQVVSKKAKVIGKLSKGESKNRREKMSYELSKFIGLKTIPAPNFAKPAKTKKKAGIDSKIEKSVNEDSKFEARFNLIGKNETIDDYPEEIKKVINEYSSLYMQRSKNHKKLIELGDSNNEDVITNRKELADKIRNQSGHMELLYDIFTAYKKDGSIMTNILSPKLNSTGSGQNQATGDESVDDLKKLKKNLQASLAKDRNQLKYQNKTRPANGKDNSMPEGPKRIRLEKRIKLKEKEVLDLDTRIAKLE